MNVKFSHMSTAFSADSSSPYVAPQKDKWTNSDLNKRRISKTKINRKAGYEPKYQYFEKPQPTCDCKGGLSFKVVPVTKGDLCGHCGYSVRWSKQITLL